VSNLLGNGDEKILERRLSVWMDNTGWSKILCAPEDCSTIIKCTETLKH